MVAEVESDLILLRSNEGMRVATATLASIETAPSVGLTVRCSMTSTGTGTAQSCTSAARSYASSSENWTGDLSGHAGDTHAAWDAEVHLRGEMTSSSSTIASLRIGSPGWAQAAWPVSRAHAGSQ
jgi:hypothetical protein